MYYNPRMTIALLLGSGRTNAVKDTFMVREVGIEPTLPVPF